MKRTVLVFIFFPALLFAQQEDMFVIQKKTSVRIFYKYVSKLTSRFSITKDTLMEYVVVVNGKACIYQTLQTPAMLYLTKNWETNLSLGFCYNYTTAGDTLKFTNAKNTIDSSGNYFYVTVYSFYPSNSNYHLLRIGEFGGQSTSSADYIYTEFIPAEEK